jgi:hypothetical protein
MFIVIWLVFGLITGIWLMHLCIKNDRVLTVGSVLWFLFCFLFGILGFIAICVVWASENHKKVLWDFNKKGNK